MVVASKCGTSRGLRVFVSGSGWCHGVTNRDTNTTARDTNGVTKNVRVTNRDSDGDTNQYAIGVTNAEKARYHANYFGVISRVTNRDTNTTARDTNGVTKNVRVTNRDSDGDTNQYATGVTCANCDTSGNPD